MKYFTLILLLGTLVGCQPSEDHVRYDYERVCVDGVVYLYSRDFYRESLTVKFNPDSSVVTCDER